MKFISTCLTIFTVLSISACDTGFLGGGQNGFKSGDQTSRPPPVLPPEGPTDTWTGTDTETLIDGDVFRDAVFWDAQLTVVRADGAANNEYNHKDIEIELKAGNTKTTGRVAAGSKDHVTTLTGVCTSGSPVQFEFAVYHQGTKISPNKSAGRGGIIAYREAPDSVLIGYEKSAVGNVTELAWHQNDDWIARISCDPAENGAPVQIKLKNTCFDQRIPNNGQNFIGKNDDANSPTNRVCSPEN